MPDPGPPADDQAAPTAAQLAEMASVIDDALEHARNFDGLGDYEDWLAETARQLRKFAAAPAAAVPAETAGVRLTRKGIALHLADRIDKVADGVDREGLDDTELRSIAADVRTHLAALEGTS